MVENDFKALGFVTEQTFDTPRCMLGIKETVKPSVFPFSGAEAMTVEEAEAEAEGAYTPACSSTLISSAVGKVATGGPD